MRKWNHAPLYWHFTFDCISINCDAIRRLQRWFWRSSYSSITSKRPPIQLMEGHLDIFALLPFWNSGRDSKAKTIQKLKMIWVTTLTSLDGWPCNWLCIWAVDGWKGQFWTDRRMTRKQCTSRCKRVHNFTRQSNFHEIFFFAHSLIFNQDKVFFRDTPSLNRIELC